MSEAERLYTAAEYLAFERAAPERHEFVRGRVYATSAGSWAHSEIQVNVTTALKNATRGRGCSVHGSDMRIWIPAAEVYKYPDASALCGRVRTDDPARDDNLLNPSLIVEVLSPSTEEYDRTEKFALYRRLESLREPIADIHAYAARRFRDGGVVASEVEADRLSA